MSDSAPLPPAGVQRPTPPLTDEEESDWADDQTQSGISESEALVRQLREENTKLQDYIEARRTDLLG